MHNMEVCPPKSKILTNRKFNEDNPPEIAFTINQEKIPKILPSNVATRILGVHWTLDGKSNETIKLAMEELETVLQKIKTKYLPGRVATYLLNASVIQKLAYRLQMIPVPESKINKLKQR